MFDPIKNYEKTKKRIGYKSQQKMSEEDYQAIGFLCGLEVHQQLKTEKKLFCRCPVGLYQKGYQFDAEIIRHMRPTLSELGEYDGTALMEFKTKKNITYRIKYESACTYDIDDTPPFLINQQALKIAFEIALLFKQNLVSELHIARKQYLDGSIPTGFQRTGIVGVAGEFAISNKTIKLIQMSIEEDACREVSDIGHERVYTTDRLGTPLIEVVTQPDMKTPSEAAEACQRIRYINRSTGKVRTGHGASRQDVNVSATGGQRVEIKGVSKIKLIPELTHNEAFRQRALVRIKEELNKRYHNPDQWRLSFIKINVHDVQIKHPKLYQKISALHSHNHGSLILVNLPGFKEILSFFTQPGRDFADEIADRLKVIACLERPNLYSSESRDKDFPHQDLAELAKELKIKKEDAQLLFMAPEKDTKTAIETIAERCELAFYGVPNETRKPLYDGTTLFERVLPGADRMYPDTDSAPVRIQEDWVASIKENLPRSVDEEMNVLHSWQVPKDVQHYLLRYNLMPFVREIVEEENAEPVFVTTLFGHFLRGLQRKIGRQEDFKHTRIHDLFQFVKKKKLEQKMLKKILSVIYENPRMDFESALTLVQEFSQKDQAKNRRLS